MGECDVSLANERKYRPRLEALALELYKARENKRDSEEDLSPKIKDFLEKAGITKYDGKKVIVNLVIPVQQEADIRKLSRHIHLDELYENNLLSVTSIEKLEKFLKKKGKILKPKDYLKKGKPYERLDIYLKRKK